VNSLTAADTISYVKDEARAVSGPAALDLIAEFFVRLQTLRMMTLGGLVGPYDAADATLLFERLAADVTVAFPDDAAAVTRLAERFHRIPGLRDADQRLTQARALIDDLNKYLIATERDIGRVKGTKIAKAGVGRSGWIVLGSLLCLMLFARLAYDPLFLGRYVYPLHGQRITDLARIRQGLTQYFQDHKSYPLSAGEGSQWNGIGWKGDPNAWIPMLVPNYLLSLPQDPRHNDNSYNQYVYRSNGTDYKLLALVPEDCQYTTKNNAEFSDPVRNAYHQCYAYGYWTNGAKGW